MSGSPKAAAYRLAALFIVLAVTWCSPLVSVAAAEEPVGIAIFTNTDLEVVLSYRADSAQTNDVSVRLSQGSFVVKDAGVTTIPDADGAGGCTVVNNEASCPAAGIMRIGIRAGDQSDALRVEGAFTPVTSLLGEAGNDYLEGAFVLMDGGDGDDTLRPGVGWDHVGGGPGTDTVTYSERVNPMRVDLTTPVGSAVEGILGGDSDTIDTATVENVITGSGDDVILGSSRRNVLTGGPGADTLSGGPGMDTADYSDHSTRVEASIGDGPNDGTPGEGDDVQVDVENLVGGSSDDVLIGQDRVAATTGANPLSGQEGENELSGGSGDDFLDGRFDSDIMQGGDGSDIVFYGDRTEAVTGTIGGCCDDGGVNDVSTLTGRGDSIGDDVEKVLGGAGNDSLGGGAGGDFLEGGMGADHIDGGPGADSLYGGPDHDLLEGGDGNDVIYGQSGLDDLSGSAGADALDGGDGEDLISGGADDDSVQGGAGYDAADYSSAPSGVDVDLSIVDPQETFGAGVDTLVAVEDLIGSPATDFLYGNDENNILLGGAGDDYIDVADSGPDDAYCDEGTDLATIDGSDLATGCEYLNDPAPPETTIDSGPTGATADSTPTFTFSSSEAYSEFECRMDSAAFELCTSPHTTQELGLGPHSFEVRAIDLVGDVDATPAIRGFSVGIPQAPAPPPVSASDKTGPVIRLGSIRTQRAIRQRGVVIEVGCPIEACTARAEGTIVLGGPARRLRLKPAAARIPLGGKARLKLRLSKRTLAAVRHALKKRKRVRATIRVTARDGSGNATASSRSIRIK